MESLLAMATDRQSLLATAINRRQRKSFALPPAPSPAVVFAASRQGLLANILRGCADEMGGKGYHCRARSDGVNQEDDVPAGRERRQTSVFRHRCRAARIFLQNRRARLPLLLLVLFVAGASGGFMRPVAAAADPVTDARARAQQLQSQIDGLNDQMRAMGGFYTVTHQRLQVYQAQIAANEGQLAAANAALATARSYLAQSAVAMYKQSAPQILDIVFGSQSFADVAGTIDLLAKIQQQDALAIAQANQSRADIINRQAMLIGARTQASQLMAQMKEQEAQITSDLQVRRQLLRGAQVAVKQALKEMAVQRAVAASLAAARLSGGLYTPQTWASAFLRVARLTVTPSNLAAITAWEMAEGGNWNNSATFNPLNTTLPEPGSTSMNWVGVQAYTSWAQGFQATVTTLYNGNYTAIIAALKAGSSAQAVAEAVAASQWGTQQFTVPVL
jgi:peptidoglycan hydrolase CwlO-like protein